MSRHRAKKCANCQRLSAQVARLEAQVAELREQVARGQKNSATSSKPPSSDIVKPPKPTATAETRTRGGQPGHAGHERPLVSRDQLSGGIETYVLEDCPTCGHRLQRSSTAPRVVQQIEIETVPLTITEHQAHASWCPHCQRMHYAALPWGVERGGLVGPRLATVIAYMKGVCHASFSTVRRFLRDVVGVTISRGGLAKIIRRVSQALAEPYQELWDQLPQAARLNVDETGHPDQGERLWTWCFRAELYTLFHIDMRRSSGVLLDVLGAEFDGVLGCDYFGAYRRYMRECTIVVQFCLAHFIRDVKFLMTLPDARDRAYGKRLRNALRRLFGVIHQRETMTPFGFTLLLEAERDRVLRLGTTDVPPTRASQNLARRLEQHGAAYFTFVTTPDVAPTNNLAEQAIRFVVLDRHVTQGTRGETGQRWCERIWTVIATCTQQAQSVFEYLLAAVTAWYEQEPVPSLLPGNS